ncbi:AAA family ATPase [Chryseobacterium sp. MMS23-Vi53]|uniref:AAA family ATPase n=1 Tax=Chryseobacterium sp. MMS23-Vi53 TaxID=3386644 RepID=UPI0039EB87FC
MKKISFKNFRRFKNFPNIDLGHISILVGRNNSGKSTMVKALLLLLDYLQNQQYNRFSFTNTSLEDANIVTFGRAKNNSSDVSDISIEFGIGGYLFSISIFGNDDDTNANVSKLHIKDLNLNTDFEINYSEKILKITKYNSHIGLKVDALGDLISESEDIDKELKNNDFKNTSHEKLRLLDRYNSLIEKIDAFNKNMVKEKGVGVNEQLFSLAYDLPTNLQNRTEDTILQELVSDFIFQNDASIRRYKSYIDDIKASNEIIEKSKDQEEVLNAREKAEYAQGKINELNLTYETLEEKIQELVDIDNYRSELSKSIDNIVKTIKNTKLYYLGANPAKQSALFSIRDKQNNLAQAIHEFKQSNISKGEQEYRFVQHWMKEFEVGVDFDIKFYAGEAYEFFIYDDDEAHFKTHLADKGMGSIQSMMIILKVATIIKKYNDILKSITIIVEEPELNLHPALQSKLANFFHEVNIEYGIDFIIETHSEYIIRKSQLLVVDNEYTDSNGLNPNPFTINYFDINNGPYPMNFTKNGKFDKNFGEGFYDEAAKSTIALIRKQNKLEQ